MKKINLHLWFEKEATVAAEFYTHIFNKSRIDNTMILSDTPSGNTEVVSFQLEGMGFDAISVEGMSFDDVNIGPYFKFNRSSSVMFYSESKNEINDIWNKLCDDGEVIIPLEEHSFSNLYGWVEDKYGLSWQMMQVEKEPRQKIKPFLMFSDKICGKAEEAIDYYTKIFKNSNIIEKNDYQEGEATSKKAKISYAEFNLEGLGIATMDDHACSDMKFNESYSLEVMCDSQKEIDYYWNALSAVPEAEQCGWLKDKYGFSWQIVPSRFIEMLENGTEEQIKRVTKAFLQMKKFNLKVLEEVYTKQT